MDNQINISNTKAGTVGGTLLVIFMNIQIENIVNTVIQAAVAAAVSFTTSMLMRYLIERNRQK